MTVEQLQVWFVDHKNDENYQHKGMSVKEFDKRANAAFFKLPKDQQEKVASVCTAYGLTDLPFAIRCRFLAQTNLFALCKLLEKYNDVSAKKYTWIDGTIHNTHEEICNAFFVRKDPTVKTFKQFADEYIDKKERLLLIPRGCFKALDLDTEIPTPDGFKRMGDIEVGDSVFGDDGKACKVVGTSEVFTDRKCYEIKFSSGETIVADADHLWVTDAKKDRENSKGVNGKNYGPRPSIKTTQQIADTVFCRKEHNHRVHLTAPIQGEDKEYNISPYVLGCWLGDGTSSNSNLTCYDPQIIDEIRAEGEVIREAPYCEYLFVFNGGKGHKDFKMRSGVSFASRLRKKNLNDNKHIPEEYLLGSYAQRLALLQGLMDTDGTCSVAGQSTFTNTNRLLAQQVRRLIASLGFKPNAICEYDASLDGVIVGKAYQVGFIAYKDTPVFRLERKRLRQRAPRKAVLSKYRRIVSVTEVSSRPTKCIAVDSPNHTYLVGQSYIPTHNSSCNMADTVQWLICYSETTILVLTGVLKLAKDFVKEIKGHFELEDADLDSQSFYGTKNPAKPRARMEGISLFQVLFAEHCIAQEEGKAYEFQTPASLFIDKECSVFAASIDQNLSGWHVGVMKLDDVVTNENSCTVDRIDGVNKQVSINNAMLHPYGFYDVIGTWYNSGDVYGNYLKHIEKCVKEGEDVTMLVYLRPAWWANENARKLGKIESEMVESDWDLLFNEPGRLTYKFLRAKKSLDPDGFAIKYLNDPTQVHRIKFPRELMIRRTVTSNQLPQQGMVVCTVDTAYSTKSWADYTVILTSLIYGGRFYIIDMKRGRFNEYELPQVIAANGLQWKPSRICIEDSVGVKWLGKETYREMDKLKIRIPIEFVPLGKGSKGTAKDQKAKPVLRYLGDERLLFVNQCTGLEEIYTELEKFGTAAGTHDDIVSALSILVEQFATYADMEGRQTQSLPSFVSDQAAKQHYDMVYGQGVFSKVYTQKSFEASMAHPELNPQEAIQATQAVSVSYFDPLQGLFD